MVGVQGAGLQWLHFMDRNSALLEVCWPKWIAKYTGQVLLSYYSWHVQQWYVRVIICSFGSTSYAYNIVTFMARLIAFDDISDRSYNVFLKAAGPFGSTSFLQYSQGKGNIGSKSDCNSIFHAFWLVDALKFTNTLDTSHGLFISALCSQLPHYKVLAVAFYM